MPIEPTALLVIRVWRETESAFPLRAEIRMTHDVSIGFERTINAADIDTVLRLVREWLSEILTSAKTI